MSLSSTEARTVSLLTSTFGFAEARAREAVAAIGDKGDVELAYNWLLDHGEEDRGGAVQLRHCPHLDLVLPAQRYRGASCPPPPPGTLPKSHVCKVPLAEANQLKYGQPCKDGCPCGENWTCLVCGDTRCSRYVQRHNLIHYQTTVAEEEKGLTVSDVSSGATALGHCLAISHSDLSVWCYVCESYVEHPRLVPLKKRMEELKFGTAPSAKAGLGAIAEDEEENAAEDGHQAAQLTPLQMHGILGQDKGWALPEECAKSGELARPGYQSCRATEYLDTEEVLDAKVTVLADLIARSRRCVAYTGAGLSTASGIRDYATKAEDSLAFTRGADADSPIRPVPIVSPFEAEPSEAHCALVAMHRAGHLQGWIQQNHDGLPQKAGMPQSGVNEIHGAWYDPGNPVVPMDGSLRPDLVEDLLEWELHSDLVLALGTSLAGMSADQVVTSAAQRFRGGQTGQLGAVVVALQRTRCDEVSSLRIFGRLDDVLRRLASKLDIQLPKEAPPTPPKQGEDSCVYHGLPYHPETGEKVELEAERGAASAVMGTTLDLRPGAKVRLVRQPNWDKERVGSIAQVIGRDPQGHFVLRFLQDDQGACHGGAAQTGTNKEIRRCLGKWWICEAQTGESPYLPVVNV